MRRLLFTSTLLAASLAMARPAAAGPSPTEHAAEDAFRRGRDAMGREEWSTALPLLRESQRLFPAAGTLLNLAVTEQKLGLVASAWKHFEEVAGLLPPNDQRVAFARKEAEKLASHVPHVRVTFTGRPAPAGTQITLDDKPVVGGALDLPVDPGAHVIVVTFPGVPPRRVEVTAGESQLIDLPVDATPGPTAAASSLSGRRLAGFVTLGVGIAALGVGTGTGIAALVDHGHLEDATNPCRAAGTCGSLASAGKALSWASTVTLVAGAAATGAGLYLVLSTPSPSSTGATLHLVPTAGGAALAGSF